MNTVQVASIASASAPAPTTASTSHTPTLNPPAAAPHTDALIYLARPDRLLLTSLRIHAPGAPSKAVTITRREKTGRYGATRDDGAPVEYVGDAEAQTFTIQARSGSSLHFSLAVRGAISGLTFVHGATAADVDRLLTSTYAADSNIHKHPHAALIGDRQDTQVDHVWQVQPPSRGRVVCAFAEFSKSDNRFVVLARFALFVVEDVVPIPISSPHYQQQARPTRLHIPSYSSIESPRVEPPLPRPDSPEIMTPINVDTSPYFDSAQQSSITALLSPPETSADLDDGPVFRATLAGLESKTEAFRLRIKKLMKRANAVRTLYVAYSEAYEKLFETMRLIAESNPSACRPVWDAYFDQASAQLQQFRHDDDALLHTAIIAPLRRIYDVDIKAAEGKKREFEDESKDFYGFVSRYLSKRNDADEKKLMDKDSKYNSKKRNFELKRFDYFCYVQDLHGGRKEHEVLKQLTLYAMTQSQKILGVANVVRELRPALETLSRGLESAGNDFKLVRSEREERRRHIEKSNLPKDESSGETIHPTLSRSGSQRAMQVLDEAILQDVPPLNVQEQDPRRKEGILWALARQGDPKMAPGVQKLNWHKFWVVLAGGQISEYRDWKEAIDHSGDPIDLRMATVRPARNTDRRFCFEVLTPNSKRVYQTTGEEELESWIKHITAAIAGILDGSASQVSLHQHNREVKQSGGNAEALFGGKLSRRSSTLTTALNTSTGSASSRPFVGSDEPRKLLSTIREAAPENSRCADCGSSAKVEWVSINLCAILCIECSGVHRSLGSHISKVRSLLLDTNSFNRDLVELLVLTGNRVANQIFDANAHILAPQDRPSEKSSRDHRVRYITAKYVDRAFVEYPSLSPNDVLLQSVTSGNIAAAYGALASRADANVIDDRTNTPVLALALAEEAEVFPLAELLYLNGAELPSSDLQGITVPGRHWLVGKIQRGHVPLQTLPLPQSSSPPANSLAPPLGSPTTLSAAFTAATPGITTTSAAALLASQQQQQQQVQPASATGTSYPREPPPSFDAATNPNGPMPPQTTLNRSASSTAPPSSIQSQQQQQQQQQHQTTSSILANGAHRLQKRISSGSRILKSPPHR
ncbi:hypothetical protein PYCC9005_004916 [Savitreella phatthalungensis]